MSKSYVDILEEQLAIDYDCTVEEVRGSVGVFRPLKKNEKARKIGTESTLLKIAVYKQKLLVMAQEEILDWCRKNFAHRCGAWLSEPENLIAINNKLQEYGQKLADTHHHYLPAKNFPVMEKRFDLKWYEKEELEVFRGDGRFWEALLFDEDIPDMLAVCAMDGDTILGLASVTRNCDYLWEIGVNVTNEGKGKGVGSYVAAAMKEEMLKRGIVPTYSTVESHIKSQRVAFRAGFEPMFYEVFSK